MIKEKTNDQIEIMCKFTNKNRQSLMLNFGLIRIKWPIYRTLFHKAIQGKFYRQFIKSISKKSSKLMPTPTLTTNCASCSSYQECLEVCCSNLFLCRDCALDETIVNHTFDCPGCERQMGRFYFRFVQDAQNLLSQGNQRQVQKYQTNTNRSFNQMTRTNSSYQTQEEELQFLHNLNNISSNNRSNAQSQLSWNNNYNQRGYNGNMTQINGFQQIPQKISLNSMIQTNSLHSNQRGGNYQGNDFQANNFRPNNQLQRNNSMIEIDQRNNFNQYRNLQQQQSNFNSHYQQNTMNINQQQYSQQNFTQQQTQSNALSVNIRKSKQTNQMVQNQCSEEFQFQDVLEQRKKLQQANTNFSSNNQSNPFNNVNRGNFNGNSHNNNFNQSNVSRNNANHSNDSHNNLVNSSHGNQRAVKSAVKLKRSDFVQSITKNNFRISQCNQIISAEDKNKSSSKDLSPTFGNQQNDINIERENFDMRGTRIKQERHEGFRLKRSNSEFTLGSRMD